MTQPVFLEGAWQRLKGKGEGQRKSRHKGSEKGKKGKRMMLPFPLSYSFPPIHLTFFLYFSLISLPHPFLSPCRKQPFNCTAFHWPPHSCSSSPISPILHTVFLAFHFFYSGYIDRKFLQNICFLQTIYNHNPKAIFWTLMRAPNLASVLSYPSNETHKSGIHEFHVLRTLLWTDLLCMDFGKNETCWFQNFGLQWKYEKYVGVPTQDFLLNYHLLTFTARLNIFLYYVYTLVLLMQYCIWKYQTICIIGPPTPTISSFTSGFGV